MQGNHFQDKRVVVLGGSSGIGLEVANQAASQGASVVIASSSAERVQKPLNQSAEKRRGRRLMSQTNEPLQPSFSKLGTFDHLVFTAGDSLQFARSCRYGSPRARHAFELRYWAALAAVKYGRSHIRKEGSIVLTTGIAGQRPQKGWVIAASVCGTIEALTRALAVELAPIRVNAVSPGVVRTNLWQSMTAAERENLYESVGKSLPVGRVGEAHEIAQAYLF